MDKIIAGLLMVAVFIGIAYGAFVFERWVHWSFYYGPKTQEMICDTVKPEFLNPDVCGKE